MTRENCKGVGLSWKETIALFVSFLPNVIKVFGPRLKRDPAEIADLVCDLFVLLAVQWDDLPLWFPHELDLLHWMFSCARNLSFGIVSKRARRQRREVLDAAPDIVSEECTAEEHLVNNSSEKEAAMQRVHEYIAVASEADRSLLLKLLLEDTAKKPMTPAERQRKRRALRRLRKILGGNR